MRVSRTRRGPSVELGWASQGVSGSCRQVGCCFVGECGNRSQPTGNASERPRDLPRLVGQQLAKELAA